MQTITPQSLKDSPIPNEIRSIHCREGSQAKPRRHHIDLCTAMHAPEGMLRDWVYKTWLMGTVITSPPHPTRFNPSFTLCFQLIMLENPTTFISTLVVIVILLWLYRTSFLPSLSDDYIHLVAATTCIALALLAHTAFTSAARRRNTEISLLKGKIICKLPVLTLPIYTSSSFLSW